MHVKCAKTHAPCLRTAARHTLAVQSKAKTVMVYLASLPADRRKAIEAVRAVILRNLDSKRIPAKKYIAIDEKMLGPDKLAKRNKKKNTKKTTVPT